MTLVQQISLIVFFLSLGGILLLSIVFPLVLLILSVFFRRGMMARPQEYSPAITLLVVVRNAQDFIAHKIENSLSLDYPSDRYEILFYSDGSTDETENIIASCPDKRLRLISEPMHHGKTSGLNRAVQKCSNEIIVFSDADALLDAGALQKLARHFHNPAIGGVCGQRAIHRDNTSLKEAQSGYIRVDSLIKKLESKTGSISSNDGKLYAIRKKLFQPIPDGVTDDFFVSLTVIASGHRFIFEPEARAYIHVPSRTPGHELSRRRRITSRSLRGIFINRRLLNPLRYGMFSFQLFTNKVLRRALPVFLIMLFPACLFLIGTHPVFAPLSAAQFLFYGAALLYPILAMENQKKDAATKALSLIYYFCIGNIGTLLGSMDFLRGKVIFKWDPVKR